MDDATRAAAASFDAIASDYDAHRPGYPDSLLDLAGQRCGLERGSPVLEVGPGTGKLTASLLSRGLRVTAIEPGPHLAAFARDRLDEGSGALTVPVARLADVELAPRSCAAVFAAASFHWIDPDVGWTRVARVLRPGGHLALLGHVGVDDPALGPDQMLVLDTLRRHAPEWTARWSAPRTRQRTIADLGRRRGDVSAVWSYLSDRELSRPAAAELFGPATVDVEPLVFEQTAQEVVGLLRTMSPYARLSRRQAAAIDAEILAHAGRPLRSGGLAVLVTARVVG